MGNGAFPRTFLQPHLRYTAPLTDAEDLQLPSARGHLDDLVDAVVLGKIKVVLLRNGRGYEPVVVAVVVDDDGVSASAPIAD